MATKKQPATRWFDGSTPIDELPPTEQLAHALVSQYGDLAPSVDRVRHRAAYALINSSTSE